MPSFCELAKMEREESGLKPRQERMKSYRVNQPYWSYSKVFHVNLFLEIVSCSSLNNFTARNGVVVFVKDAWSFVKDCLLYPLLLLLLSLPLSLSLLLSLLLLRAYK